MDGIISVAFGEEYDTFAAKVAVLTRSNTDIPIAIISNLKTRSPLWNNVSNIQFIYVDAPQDDNRIYKIKCIDYSPFDRTLFIDADAFIQNQGIDGVFDLIPDCGILVDLYGVYGCNTDASQLYNSALFNAKLQFPIDIFYGAFFGFKKNGSTQKFFDLWLSYWKINGCGRDMPALACAVKSSGIEKKVVADSDNIFSWKENKSAIIQHEFDGFLKNAIQYGDFSPYKPFDKKIQHRCIYKTVIIRNKSKYNPT
jgi:hypothetical protein